MASQSPDPTRLYTFVTADSDSPLVKWFPDYVASADEAQKDLALTYAVHYRRTDMVELLLRHNAYANSAALTCVQQYPAHFLRERPGSNGCAKSVLDEAYIRRDVDMIRLLLTANASLRYSYRMRMSLPRHAIFVNDEEMLRVFVDHGWNVNIRYDMETHLHFAIHHSRNGLVKFLLDQGADPDMQCGDERSRESNTNVHECIRNGNRESLTLLMQHGVAINVYNRKEPDEGAYTALTYAIQRYLQREAEAEDDELGRRSDIIKDILEYSVDFEYPDYIDIQDDYMLEFYEEDDYQDDIPVPVVIRDLVNTYRNKQSVDYLRNLQPNQVNLQDAWGKTALHRAVENAQFEAVRILIVEKHAREDIQDFWGNTAAQALEKRYLTEVSKQGQPDPFRFQEGDAVAAAKLPMFRRIGRFLCQQRLFREKLGPRMRRSDDPDADYYPTDIALQVFPFLF
jgi:ankyrin repeat protein